MTEKVFWQVESRAQNHFAEMFAGALSQNLKQEVLKVVEKNPPQVACLENLLKLAQEEINEIWQNKISPILAEFLWLWTENLQNSPEEIYFKKELDKHEFLDKQIEARNFTDLEGLRDINPQIWKSLVGLSMMRQEQELCLVKLWVEKMTDKDFVHFGLNKNHLLIAMTITSQIGPLINQTYLKQIDLGFTDGVRLLDPGSKTEGATSVYEVLVDEKSTNNDSDYAGYRRVPYKEMFPTTWPLIAQKYREIAQLTLQLCPEDGREFADYLLALAAAYDSPETGFAQLSQIWKNIENLQKKLIGSNWPINLIAAGHEDVGKTFNKADANLVVGLKTETTKKLELKYQIYLETAQKILNSHDLNNKHQLKAVALNVLLASMGSGSWWANQGEADDQAICYPNSVEAISQLGVSPIYLNLLNQEMSEEERAELLEIMVLSTVLHELGHTFFPLENPTYATRIGYYAKHAELVDEIKADTTGIRIFWEREKEKGTSKRAHKYLEFIIAYCHDYIYVENQNDYQTETDAHQEMAEIMLGAMIRAGGIKKEPTGYSILDVTKSFESLVAISKTILDKCTDPTMNEAKMAACVDQLSQMKFNGEDALSSTKTIFNSKSSSALDAATLVA